MKVSNASRVWIDAINFAVEHKSMIFRNPKFLFFIWDNVIPRKKYSFGLVFFINRIAPAQTNIADDDFFIRENHNDSTASCSCILVLLKRWELMLHSNLIQGLMLPENSFFEFV